ncbi:MAG: ribonuclease J [Clostridia bacterium]|nr:ribonuclease J [Clostridia bacterium]
MAKGKTKKLRVIPLGGLGEIGKNITLLEYSDNILIIDCGIGFPDDDMFGVDLVTPDFTYLVNNRDKIVGLVVTHGHEDHIGSIPYLLHKLDIPIFATRLTLGILENKFTEHKFDFVPRLHCVAAGEHVKLGVFDVEFIRVNHSIADAVCLAIKTPVGVVIHSGDFKIDPTPVEGEMTDLTRLGELGREGVKLLMCESTNVERQGYTPSERKVGESLVRFFEEYRDKRIVISTFSSNVHRVQQIIDIANKYGRKVAVTGRSMINIVKAATELGYMNVPAGVLCDISEAKKYPPSKMTIVSTGSQGEPMSGLYRMAFGLHDKVELGADDIVIISATAIPGNEKLVGNIINELFRRGVCVLSDVDANVHVSGHACQEELKIFHALTKPEYFMPVHGEARHLFRHKELAEHIGMEPNHIFVSEIGKILEIDQNGARYGGTVPAGVILVDGTGVGDVGNVVLRDRRKLAEEGLIIVTAAVDFAVGDIAGGPEVVSRGFIYEKESEETLSALREIARDSLYEGLRRDITDWAALKGRVRDDIAKYVFQTTRRKPMVMVLLMDV